MKALILAAGRGTRIQTAHKDQPKCLIRSSSIGWTILDHQIDGLFSAGIDEIGIVVGYEKDQITRHVYTNYRDCARLFHFIVNPLFATTNNIYSFWLARTWLNGDAFLCLNTDVVFDPRILTPAVESAAPVTMIVDRGWRDETMKVIISEGRVIRMNKRITRSEFSGTYIGITGFARSVQAPLFARIERLIHSSHDDEFFNVALQELADEGVHVGFTSTGELPWAEIDDPGDLAFARSHVFPRLGSIPIAA